MDGYKQVHVWMDVEISLYMNAVKRLKYLNMATRLYHLVLGLLFW
jgi:hypothetical protein